MSVHKQNLDGTWSEAEPLPFLGWKAKVEQWCRMWNFNRTANFFAWLDERKLGR